MTIYDIAKMAGVSASSVSRVINDKPGVNPETRRKIKTLLEDNNYVPNEIARGLVSRNSRMVGVLVPEGYSLHLMEGAYHITGRLSEVNYGTIILKTGCSEAECAEGIRSIEERNVDAVVLMGSRYANDKVARAVQHFMPKKPVFLLNGEMAGANVYSVISDECGGLSACVKFLVQKGRKHIVYISDAMDRPSSFQKRQGFLQGVRETGIYKDMADTRRFMYEGLNNDIDSGERIMEQALLEHPDTDGLICATDMLACGAVRVLHRKGIRIPEQIAVIGVDNSSFADACYPRLTSLNNMILESGDEIASKLIASLEGHEPKANRIMLLTEIVERETT